MKSIIVKSGAKAGLAAFAIALIAIASSNDGMPGGGSRRTSVLLNDELVQRGPSSDVMRVLVPAEALCAPAIVANGGTGIRADTLFKNNSGMSIDLRIEEDVNARLGLLASGGADIVWTSADSLARAYPLVRACNPVAILLAGYSRGGDLVVARTAAATPEHFRGARIVCAANTPHHFMALYLLSLSGVRPEEVKWRLTRTPAAAAALFARGKADICASARHDLASTSNDNAEVTVLLSTEDAPRLVTGLFITRESAVALRKEELSAFMKGWFNGLASMTKDMEPAAALIARELLTDTAGARAELERCSFAGYAENRAFFSIDDAEWGGFSQLFDTARNLYYGEGIQGTPLSGFARNTELLVSLEAELRMFAPPAKDRQMAPQAGGRPLPGARTFYFPKNRTIPDFDSRGALARFARDAHVFSGCAVALYGGEDPAEDRWRDLAPQRAREVARLLVSEHRVPSARIILPNERIPVTGPGNGSARRVDAYLVPLRRER